MNKNCLTHIFFLPLIAFLLFCCGQEGLQQPAQTSDDASKVTIKGTITYIERINRYLVKGEEPPEEYMVENENTDMLKKLVESGKQVTIEGHTTIGADMLFIEKIEGKPYPGSQESTKSTK